MMKVSEATTVTNINQNEVQREQEIEMIIKHYSPYRRRLLRKRMPILTDCRDILRVMLHQPELSLWDMRQMTRVLLEGNISDKERSQLIRSLYSEISKHPQWTTRGNVDWLDRKIKEFRASQLLQPEWRSSVAALNDPELAKAA